LDNQRVNQGVNRQINQAKFLRLLRTR
jgi:hypothetical protein